MRFWRKKCVFWHKKCVFGAPWRNNAFFGIFRLKLRQILLNFKPIYFSAKNTFILFYFLFCSISMSTGFVWLFLTVSYDIAVFRILQILLTLISGKPEMKPILPI